MPKYIINAEMTKNLHNALQEEMFSHCEDFEVFPEDTLEEMNNHCKLCEYYLACKLSNEITFRIATNRW